MSRNPVLRALEQARLDAQLAEWEAKEAELRRTVELRLGGTPSIEETADLDGAIAPFKTWCERNGFRYFPAQPATLAQYLLEHSLIGIEKLADTIAAVSETYFARGLPNPVATWIVAAAMQRAGDIAPPRSWPNSLKAQFFVLPHMLKKYVADHDIRREKVLRRAQNEAARARRALAEMRTEARSGETTTGDLNG